MLPAMSWDGGIPAEGEEEPVESAPTGDPAGFAVGFAHQESAEAGRVAEVVAEGMNLQPRALGAAHHQPRLGDDAGGLG